MKLLTKSLALIVIGCAIGVIISPKFSFGLFLAALVVVVIGGIVQMFQRAPIDPEWAEEPEWCNCGHCEKSSDKSGHVETFTPKPCAPMNICPECQEKELAKALAQE